MTTVIEELVSNVLETPFETFSNEAVEDVKKRFIDTIGCAIGGAKASGNSALLDLVREWGGKQEATVLVYGDRVPVHDAAMMNCVMCRSFDYAVVGPAAEGRPTGHQCETTEPTALTIAEYKGSSSKELITSAILGCDLAARVAITEDVDWKHSFSAIAKEFGATAIAGRLWGLSHSQFLNAFGIIVNQVAGTFQSLFDGVDAFKLNQGLAARNAIFSVELASKGFTGVKDALLSPNGLFPLYCRSYQPELLTKDLGKTFYTKGLHKLRPSCYGNHAAIECCLKILSQYDINAENVAEVTVVTPPSVLLERALGQPFEMGASQPKALFNTPYGVANVLMRKSTRLEHYTDEFIHDPKVVELAGKVRVLATVPPGLRRGVDVKIRMKNGQEFSTSMDTAPRGMVQNPLTMEEIRNKFWHNVDFSKTVPRKNAEKALAMLEHLEEVDDVSKIVKLLVADT